MPGDGGGNQPIVLQQKKPGNQQTCWHCGKQYLFSCENCLSCFKANQECPNIFQARQELDWLLKRYDLARESARQKGCLVQLDALEEACINGEVVINRELKTIAHLAESSNYLYTNYYEKIRSGSLIPGGNKWDTWRQMADAALFPGYFDKIKFAALSLDGNGLSHYGECTMVCNLRMIKDRTTFFHTNTTVFLLDIPPRELVDNPRLGYRASLENVGILAGAKLANALKCDTQSDEFTALVQKSDPNPERDVMIEAHIYGTMNIDTLKQVRIKKPKRARSDRALKTLKEKLKKAGVGFEEY